LVIASADEAAANASDAESAIVVLASMGLLRLRE
jgi:hypothetical protein